MYDVLIVGAGISGLRTAELLSEAGLDVIVLEKKETVGGSFGESLQGFPIYQYRKLDFEIPSYPAKNFTIRTGVDTKITFEFDKPLIRIVKRGSDDSTIDSFLLKKAIKAGAEVRFSSNVEKINLSTDIAETFTADGKRFASRIVVGADGVFSAVRRLGGFTKLPVRGIGYIAKMKNLKLNPLEIIITLNYKIAPMAYGYIVGYPEGPYSTFGLTLRPEYVNKPVKEYFEKFRTYLKDVTDSSEIVDHFIGFVTCGDGRQQVVKLNSILTGEAGGFQDPIAGFGMTPALLSAKIASEVIKKAIKNSDIKILEEYAYLTKKELIDAEIKKTWRIRKFILESLTNKELEIVVKLIGTNPTFIEKAIAGGEYSKVIRKVVAQAIVARPTILLLPFRYIFREIFGAPKVSPEPSD